MAGTVLSIPYDALGPELSEDSEERSNLFFVQNLFDGGGTLFAVGLPLAMASLAGTAAFNGDVCKDNDDSVRECLEGKSCGGYLEGGPDEAYALNSTLWRMWRCVVWSG